MRFEKQDDRESLERVRRWPRLLQRFPMVYIYSARYNQYWRMTPTATELVPNIVNATPMESLRALGLVADRRPDDRIQFVRAAVAQPDTDDERGIYYLSARALAARLYSVLSVVSVPACGTFGSYTPRELIETAEPWLPMDDVKALRKRFHCAVRKERAQ